MKQKCLLGSYLIETTLGNCLEQFISSFRFVPSNDTCWLHRQGFPCHHDDNINCFLKEGNFCIFILVEQHVIKDNSPDLNLNLSQQHTILGTYQLLNTGSIQSTVKNVFVDMCASVRYINTVRAMQ